MNRNRKLDFIYSTDKDHAALLPLFHHLRKTYPTARMVKIHRRKMLTGYIRDLAPVVVAAYDVAIRRARERGWSGKSVYVDHGLSPVKYYAYRYRTFHECDLLFYPGPVFQDIMAVLNPEFDHGLQGGLPKMDQLVTLEVDREAECRRLGLAPEKPIVVFAPTWGGKYRSDWGIANARHLDGYPNLIIAPHPSDYRIARRFDAVVPEEKGNINQLLRLADVVVSDVSSVVGEAAVLDTPVVQMILPEYPGCFPQPERRHEGLWLDTQRMKSFEAAADPVRRPFKLAYLDEDWIMGHTAHPQQIKRAVDAAIAEPDRFSKERKFWAERSCFLPDGRSTERIGMMIETFLEEGIRKQFGRFPPSRYFDAEKDQVQARENTDR